MSGTSFFRAYGSVAGRQKVDATTFGANFLFDRDRVGERGTFDEKAETLDLGLIRYPGGAIAEESFSLASPDRRVDVAHGRDLVPLSDFIKFVEDGGYEYSLVIPTKKYMLEVAKTGNVQTLHHDLERFYDRLNNGDYGDKKPKIVEVGNMPRLVD